jgi:two-component system cell cycle sensor histidine kinase/response regulator CckA
MFGNSLPQGSETILLVEHEQIILNTILHILKPEGYCVLQSQSPKGALQIGSRHDYEIDLLLTDVILPGLYGWELAELMKLDYPQLHVLYIAGGCEDDIQELGDASNLILRKPFHSQELARAVRKALGEHVDKKGLW